MNQCKRVSDCPADRLAQCRGEAVQARCDALQGLLNKADQQISDLTHAATVPPAGDVEVLGWMYIRKGWIEPQIALTEHYALRHDPSPVKLVDRAHVTRLTAERDGLLAEVGQWRASNKANALAAGELVASLQSELTKALEYIKELVAMLIKVRDSEVHEGRLLYESITKLATRNVDESCGQDAEAAKGGSDE